MTSVLAETAFALAFLGDLLAYLEQSAGALTYALMVLVLVLGTCGLPVPEEAICATAGALSASGRVAWPLAYAVGWSSIVLLDLTLHAAGTWLGPGLERSRLGRRVTPERWASLRSFVQDRGLWAVVAARFVMGTRIPVFLLAGALGMPRRRFLPVCAGAAAVSVAIPLALGYFLGARLPDLLDGLATARWLLLGLALLLVLGWWRRRRRRPSDDGA